MAPRNPLHKDGREKKHFCDPVSMRPDYNMLYRPSATLSHSQVDAVYCTDVFQIQDKKMTSPQLENMGASKRNSPATF